MEPVQPVVKQSNFLVTLLSVLLLVSVFIAGFFAYQTQNLVKELTKLQVTPTPIATTEPDLTADWKTYTNEKYGFSIRYPNELDLNAKEVDIKSNALDYYKKCSNGTYDGCGGSEWPDYKITFFGENNIAKFDIDIWEGDMTEPFAGKLKNNKTYLVSTFRLFGENGKIEPLEVDIMKLINDSLSFTDQVACTMEAKVCPDGSYVSRSGPKCEFEACPTPKN